MFCPFWVLFQNFFVTLAAPAVKICANFWFFLVLFAIFSTVRQLQQSTMKRDHLRGAQFISIQLLFYCRLLHLKNKDEL
jgi:hypothetical protein